MSLIETSNHLKSKLGAIPPDLALIAGSGLGGITTALTEAVTVPYTEIPDFPTPTVRGHAGQVVCGNLAGRKVLVYSGRFHVYEGRPLTEITYPVRVAEALGCRRLVVTNAAGGINSAFRPGDLMLITDHINQLGVNPLSGLPEEPDRPRFIDLSEAYARPLIEKFLAAAAACQLSLRPGVYLATTGPSYETPAEIRAFARWGADAVGMSTVPEVILARYLGLEVAGLSCITNFAAGIGTATLNHEEVLAIGKTSGVNLVKLLTAFIQSL